ncbi:diguanylate cyclase [Roseibium sp. RKSG952]|uniref:diguanylate cyclase domain-containing protein n=1 Tax=Roseibium sp. RKSG952 TaxID=2529384 RepID=UPI0018AD1F4C
MSATAQNNVIDMMEMAYHRLKWQVEQDELTGLGNRTKLSEFLKTRLAHAAPEGELIGLLHLDLDHFKHINDYYGHPAGDHALKHAAKSLRRSVGTSGLTCRIGGDELIAVITDLKGLQQLETLAETVLRLLDQPLPWDLHELQLSGSIGLAIAPAETANADTLLSRADIALYAAKNAGRNQYRHYTAELGFGHRQKQQVMKRLDIAIENETLDVELQPVLCSKTGETTYFEAIAHWPDAGEGPIDPARLLSQEADFKRLARLEGILLKKGCSELKRVGKAHGEPVKLEVNISNASLNNPAYPSEILAMITETGLTPDRIILGFNETLIRFDQVRVMAAIKDLSELGFLVAITGIGGGLQAAGLPIYAKADFLKISPKLVREGETNTSAAQDQIVCTAHIGAALGVKTIACGITNKDQITSLEALGFSLFQGPFFSMPR